jgi:hypothetical protein
MIESNLPFYKKLNLDLDTNDWRFINYLSHTYLSKVEALGSKQNLEKYKEYYTTSSSKSFEQYKHYFLKGSDNNYRNENIFKKITNLFKPDSNFSSIEHIYKFSQISFVKSFLLPHKDKRKSVISIPIIKMTEPVYWYQPTLPTLNDKMILIDKNSYREIGSYDYTYPTTLLNTSIFHGSPNNLTNRIFFQIGFGESFETVVDNLRD